MADAAMIPVACHVGVMHEFQISGLYISKIDYFFYMKI